MLTILALASVLLGSAADPGEDSSLVATYRIVYQGERVGEASVHVRDGTRESRATAVIGNRPLMAFAVQPAEEAPGHASRIDLVLQEGSEVNRLHLERKDGRAVVENARGGGDEIPEIYVGHAPLLVGGSLYLLAAVPYVRGVPRLPQTTRAVQWIKLPSLEKIRATVEYVGLFGIRYHDQAGRRETRSHRFNVNGPDLHLEIDLDVTGEPLVIRDRLSGLRFERLNRGQPEEAGEDAARRRDAARPHLGADHEIIVARDGVALHGSLATPAPGRTRFPAALLLSSSMPSDRHGNGPGSAPPQGYFLRSIGWSLLEQGVAVLSFDDRGLGESPGEHAKAGLAVRVADAAAFLKELAQNPNVDPERIILVGHEEGALIAPLAAQKAGISPAMWILIGAPSTSLARLWPERTRHALAAAGLNPAYQDRVVSDQEKLLDWLALAEPDTPQPRGQGTALALDRGDLDWWRDHLAFQPRKAWQQARGAFLILHGGRDLEVGPRHAGPLVATLRRAEAGYVEERTLEDLDFWLMDNPTGDPARAAEKDRRMDRRASRAIGDFTRRLLRALGQPR